MQCVYTIAKGGLNGAEGEAEEEKRYSPAIVRGCLLIVLTERLIDCAVHGRCGCVPSEHQTDKTENSPRTESESLHGFHGSLLSPIIIPYDGTGFDGRCGCNYVLLVIVHPLRAFLRDVDGFATPEANPWVEYKVVLHPVMPGFHLVILFVSEYRHGNSWPVFDHRQRTTWGKLRRGFGTVTAAAILVIVIVMFKADTLFRYFDDLIAEFYEVAGLEQDVDRERDVLSHGLSPHRRNAEGTVSR